MSYNPVRKKQKKNGPTLGPARQQIETRNLQREESSGDYNIWYGRNTNDYGRNRAEGLPADTRCDSKLDSGVTKADQRKGDRGAYFCMFFAKGACASGKECGYYHRVPTLEECNKVDPTHDIFGRSKYETEKDDMSGRGSFARECRTLYVGKLPVPKIERGSGETRKRSLEEIQSLQHKKMMSVLHRHFGEWGAIEHISYKDKLNCAFVRYHHRCHAEFAKVAMNNQKLDGNENLNIRWSYDDPNPHAKARIQAENLEKVAQALEQKQGLWAKQNPSSYLPSNQPLPPGYNPYTQALPVPQTQAAPSLPPGLGLQQPQQAPPPQVDSYTGQGPMARPQGYVSKPNGQPAAPTTAASRKRKAPSQAAAPAFGGYNPNNAPPTKAQKEAQQMDSLLSDLFD